MTSSAATTDHGTDKINALSALFFSQSSLVFISFLFIFYFHKKNVFAVETFE